MSLNVDDGASGAHLFRKKALKAAKIFSLRIPGLTVFSRDPLVTFKENDKIKIH